MNLLCIPWHKLNNVSFQDKSLHFSQNTSASKQCYIIIYIIPSIIKSAEEVFFVDAECVIFSVLERGQHAETL